MINLLIPNFEFWDRNHGYLEIASCQSESLMRYPFLTTGRKTPQISCEKEQQKVPRKSDPWITPVIWFCTALGSYQSSRGCSWSLVTYSFVCFLMMQSRGSPRSGKTVGTLAFAPVLEQRRAQNWYWKAFSSRCSTWETVDWPPRHSCSDFWGPHGSTSFTCFSALKTKKAGPYSARWQMIRPRLIQRRIYKFICGFWFCACSSLLWRSGTVYSIFVLASFWAGALFDWLDSKKGLVWWFCKTNKPGPVFLCNFFLWIAPFLNVKKGAEELIPRIFRENPEKFGFKPTWQRITPENIYETNPRIWEIKKPLPLDTLGVRPKISRL